MKLTYYSDSIGYYHEKETLTCDGEEIPIELSTWLYPGEFRILLKDTDEVLMEGTWYYRNGSLVLDVEFDLVYGGKYPEIVLKPTELRGLLLFDTFWFSDYGN